MGTKTRVALVVAGLLVAFMAPRVARLLEMMDTFLPPLQPTPNTKHCCRASGVGRISFPECSAQGSAEAARRFLLEGFEDLTYVQVPVPGKEGLDWGALACAGDLHRVFHDPVGPDEIRDGECALVYRDGGAALQVASVPIRNFPHLRLAFHPHGLHRTVVGDRPIAGFPPAAELPQPHEDSSQRIYAVNHGYGRGDEAVLVFRLVFVKPDAASQTGPLAELYYEGDISHPSFGQRYRGSFNELYVDDSDPSHSAMYISNFAQPSDSIKGKTAPATMAQRLAFPMGILSALMDRFTTTILRCPFVERDTLSTGSVSSTAAEEEETQRESGSDPVLGKLHHADVNFRASECTNVLTNLLPNGVTGLKLFVPPARKGGAAKAYTVVFVVDLARHELIGLVSPDAPSGPDVDTGAKQTAQPQVFLRSRMAHSADNVEFDPTSAPTAPIVSGRENWREFTPDPEDPTVFSVRNLSFSLGSIANLGEAMKLFRDHKALGSGGLLQLSLTLAYSPDDERQGLPPIRVGKIDERDLVLQDGTLLTGVSSAVVLHAAAPDEVSFAVLGSYCRHGLLICPI